VEENFPEAAIGKFLQWLYNGRFECIDLTELSDIDYVAEVFEVPEMKALVNTKVEDLRKRVEGSTATDNFTDRVKFAEYIYKSSVNVYGGTLDLQRSDMRKKISQGLARDCGFSKFSTNVEMAKYVDNNSFILAQKSSDSRPA